ncbi:hypothetical protein QAD02_012253 [Eretmocerus hayati]|uniref:Uncharacterized protein n=1 Tax=Eretmocerus hayati TaxID=131215 RepID=A0ACC2P0V7_9HYME|nr:hypothetical protein QAD02_012253 [Eretmocerus hayati]
MVRLTEVKILLVNCEFLLIIQDKTIKDHVAVVVAFFICWAPFHMQRLIAIYGKRDYRERESNDWMEQLYLIFTYVSGVLYYFSTTINPILYNIMSNKFREAFMETLARSCRMSRLVIPRERRSYSSLSRSQQRNPGNNPSKTTGVSVTTGMAQQESTDCSGNSYRDDEPARPAVLDLLPSEHPLIIYDAKQQQHHAKDAGNIEFSASKSPSLSMMSATSMQRAFKNGAQSPIVATKDTPLGSPENRAPQVAAKRSTVQSKVVDPKKKWWRLLDWLPGLKSLRASSGPILDSNCEASDTVDSSSQGKPIKDENFVQLDTFRTKDESCRPV